MIPPTLLTTSNIVFNRSSVNAASVTLVRLPGTHYLTASSSSRTDTSRFKQLVKSHLFRIAFWHFVSAPGQFVSRALQVRICICICICMVHGYKHSFTYCRVNNFSDDSHRTTSMYTQTVVPLVTAHKGALFRPRRSRTHTQISV